MQSCWLSQNSLPEERWWKAISRGTLPRAPGSRRGELCAMFPDDVPQPMCAGTSLPKSTYILLEKKWSVREKPSYQNALGWKEIVLSFPPVLKKKKAFYFLKGLTLHLFQTRPFGAFQRGFVAALGRQCQRALDFWSLIWKNVSNSDPTVSFSKVHAIISYCTSSWHYIWSYPSSYPSDGSHELPHLSNSSLSWDVWNILSYFSHLSQA